ncbi:hypothetical protein [Haloarchaeobius litoreus]|uniref:Uncharacterized protein n=1 Tax=Haloarchaeobius litoreus TaxID=755306 RepID=A0ABD6DMK2_9EURY|nr:hypothetical protein [Haloarchaeobius litoreus]
MSTKTTFALFGALLLVVGAVAPAAAAAGATPAQPVDSTATDLTPDDNETDDNETDLPDNETDDADENETDIDGDNETELDGNETDSEQSSADAHNEFARMLTEYVQNVTNDSNVSAPGLHIAEWVIEHNPGNAPEHAGPPAHAGPGADNTTANETDGGQGPPDHVGDDGDDDEEEDDGSGSDNGSSASVFAFLAFF